METISQIPFFQQKLINNSLLSNFDYKCTSARFNKILDYIRFGADLPLDCYNLAIELGIILDCETKCICVGGIATHVPTTLLAQIPYFDYMFSGRWTPCDVFVDMDCDNFMRIAQQVLIGNFNFPNNLKKNGSIFMFTCR